MWRDIRYAVQGLWRSPAFTVSAVLALGLAIGANATIFGLVDALWFRPPGVSNPGEIVRIFSTTASEQEGWFSYPEYLEMRDQTTSFDEVVAKGPRGASMPDADGTPELVLVNVVTTNFFTALGVAPAAGRLFTPADESVLAAQPVVVLGHEFWRRRFGGDPAIVGQSIRLIRGGPVSVMVLGVLPASFRDMDAAADRDVWMPPATWVFLSNPRELERRDERWFQLLARRKTDVPVQTASADVAHVAAGSASAYPDSNAGRGARAISDFRYRIGNGGANAATLLGLVLMVVLITCVNVANLLIARAAARTRELAVRVALGASRRRLARQLMTESAILGAFGALAGLTLALWLVRFLPALIGAPPGFRSFLLFQVDARVFLFTLAVTTLTTMVFGIAPSWMAARADVAPLIKGESVLGRGVKDRLLQQGLVMSQIAVSLVLLCGAAVLARSFAETARADIGLTRRPVLTAWITGADFTRAAVVEGLRRIEALPGVTRAAIAFRAPLSLSGGGMAQPVYFPDRPPSAREGLPDVKYNRVSAGYFEAVGTRLLRGRAFTPQDEDPGEPVIVVNEQFERRFFPGGQAIDRRVRPGGAAAPLHRIVGVVQDAAINQIGETPEPYFYLPFWRAAAGGEVTFLVQASVDAGSLAASVQSTLKSVDPHLEPRRLLTMGDYIAYSARTYRSTAVLAAVLAGVGLLLTVLGVYGVIAYRTSNRAREIAIRVALGARRAEVVGLVMRDGATAAALGLVVGLPAALAATRALAALVFRVNVWDPIAFGAAAAVLTFAVCAATAMPAWRAARTAPSSVLRDR